MAQATNSPVGIWAVAITGADRGLTYLTFSNTSNDFVWTGYGISLKSFGPFTIAGTWGFNSKAQVVGGYTQSLPSGDVAGTVKITLPGGDKFLGSAVSAGGHHSRLVGQAVGTVPDINGAWSGEVHTHGTAFFESYTFAASTNLPGWVDVTGAGTGPSGSFTVAGALIVAADNDVNGYTIRDLGSSGIVTSSFSGKFNSLLTKAKFVGKDGNNKSVVIDATKE
jgi:hypothetical protein